MAEDTLVLLSLVTVFVGAAIFLCWMDVLNDRERDRRKLKKRSVKEAAQYDRLALERFEEELEDGN